MVVRRLRRERHLGPRDASVPAPPARSRAEPAAYWLLYVVAFGAVVLHWEAGNGMLALLCGAAVVVSVRDIARSYRHASL